MRSICSLMEELFLDIRIGARHIGFGLIVVVIGNKILDGVVGEKALELAIELGGEGFVGGEDQGGTLRRLDHLGHGKSFAGAGDAEQHLGAILALYALHQFRDGERLVALGDEIGRGHETLAAFGFLRPRRPVRHPRLVLIAEFRAAFAQQVFQRRGGGGDGGVFPGAGRGQDAGQREGLPGGALRIGRGGGAGRRSGGRRRLPVVVSDAERPGKIGVEFAGADALDKFAGIAGPRCFPHIARRLAIRPDIARLRALAEPLRRRGARPVGGGEIIAAVTRIIGGRPQPRWRQPGWRRVQPSLRADACGAAIDGGIEQVRQSRRDRRQHLARRLGARRPRRVLRARVPGARVLGPLGRRVGAVGWIRHTGNMVRGGPQGKGNVDRARAGPTPASGKARTGIR